MFTRKTKTTATANITIDNVGEVVLAQSKRAKQISITIKPFKPVRVAFPPRISFKKAKAYLDKHLEWVKKNTAYVRKVESQHNQTLNDQNIPGENSRQYLVDRLDEMARIHGFSYNRVFIRNQKTRWGSCSEKNNINLNINLLKLKPELMDYVIIHELLHTRIKNHSRAYWTELDKYVGNAKQLDKQLKKHHLGL